jgi:hypothetical protein
MKPAAARIRRTSPIAFLVVVVYLFGSLLADVHHAAVEHEVCAEHGELVHVDGHVAETAAHDDLETSEDAPAIHSSDPAGEAGHEHCALLLGRTEESIPDVTPVLVTRTLLETSSALPTNEVHRAHEDLVRLAPKQSPPA